MGWCILCCVAQSDVLSLLYWFRDFSMRDVTCVLSVFAVIGFGPCRCCRRQSVVLAMVRNWLQDRRGPMVVMSTYLFFPYKLKITICRRVYLHSNLGLDSDDVQWDKLFTEWQILLNCSLISLCSSHDLNWKHDKWVQIPSFGKVFHWHFVCWKNFKRNLVADFWKEMKYCSPFFYGQKIQLSGLLVSR